jgi:NADPH-dependent glutamate synthase beta subunit-like oxidoreductase/NAD-dependent dihydropyrimidine dehydrogenase PreA subunit
MAGWQLDTNRADAPCLAAIDRPPCTRACPAGIDVKRYVTLIADGRFEEAAAVIRRANPLASVCGYLCSRPCELECTRNAETGRPVPIRALKRFVCQFSEDQGLAPESPEVTPRPERVAVIGAGPAGLTAARDLSLAGFKVTMLEARPSPGGLLACEVPESRLPRDVLNQDIAAVEACGVEIRCNTPVEGETAVPNLLKEYDAVLLATGAGKGLKTGLHGESGLKGVTDAMTLLRNADEGRPLPKARIALVTGSAPMAVAVAHMLARADLARVYLVFPGDRAHVAADPQEVESAIRDGVTLLAQRLPVKVLGQNGWFSGLKCVGANTRPRPHALGTPPWTTGAAEEELDGDLLVAGMEREPHWDQLSLPDEVEVTAFNTVKVASDTLKTDVEGLFAAGEAATGPRGVVEAVASGRRAARAIAHWLNHKQTAPDSDHENSQSTEHRGYRVQLPHENPGRAGDAQISPTPLAHHPADLAASVLEHEAQDAARTCLRCGPCATCSSCSVHCPVGLALAAEGSLLRVAREEALQPQDLAAELLVAEVDPLRCRGCGRCEQACPYSAARVQFGRMRSVSEINQAFCRGCGHCAAQCPTQAIAYPCLDGGTGDRDGTGSRIGGPE